MTRPEFFAGAASGSSRLMAAWAQEQFGGAPRPDRIMVNYQTMNNTPDRRWERYELFYDPGAYSLFAPEHCGGQDRDDYPQTAAEYLRFVRENGGDRYAWQDYVCEPEVRETRGWTVEDAQEKTTEAHIECADAHDDLGIDATPVAVVQGWTPEDYARHAQSLVDHGLVTERMGIGTVCGRSSAEEVRNVIAAVRRVLPDVELHAFGLDKKAYIPAIIDELASTDTLAYCYRYKRPAGWSRWQWVLKHYLEHRADWDQAIDGAEYEQDLDPVNETLTAYADGGQR